MSGKPAARVSDPTACPIPGHGTNPIVAGSPDVLFDSLPAARMGDPTDCGSSLASAVIPTVLINNKPATVLGTVGSHGNPVTAGSGTVLIGASGGGAGFTAPLPLLLKGFDICVQLLDQASGAPMKNMAYTATLEDGSEVHGTTDANGLTHTLGKKDTPQTIALSVKPSWLLRGE
ncbi:PAAR domain-containing protein [Stutzerimonas stutzeri]|uniref:PAAR domain-containing protein n=1 Tax=Stutzerimonas stutzeri TaxID=316 RepID=UPI00210B5BC4|nr:PAAR domain-containing protein [Stutzerimonas stutzeri]MCQ4242931.1 PAAR domain-containing protein [Stutzerimonas stutzeri]